MTSLRVLRLALFAALAIVLGAFQPPSVANAQSTRVRKAWRSYSASEKKTFIGALQSAMESGMHYYFAEIHAARPTNDFAHGNCGFLLWHRKFLLAYENMLRAQGPSFKDVTLPYWNYFQDHDMNMAAGVACNSIATCSNFLADLGGSSRKAPVKAVNLGSAGRIEGYCVADGVAKSACASPAGAKSGACDRCIVRGDWSSPGVFLPLSKMGILNSIRTITTAKTNPHDQLRQVLEGGFHADVHNTLGGTMRTMASPFDPVFFGHHGTIDLMHFIHNRCHYGKKDNKKFDVFSKCTVTTADGAAYTINANTDILIRYGNKPAEHDPVIGKFFKDLGSTYNDFANAEKLKSASNNYRYVVDDYFEAVFKSQGIVCPPGTFASESKHKHHKHHKHHEDGSEYEEETVEVPVYEIIATLSTCGDELMERNPNMTEIEVAIQESVLECEATRQKSGHELEDYTPEFRQAFSMAADSHPQCYRLLNDVKNGAIKLEVSDFCRQEYGRLTGTNLTEGEFGKPLPPASGSDSDEYDSESDSYDSGSSSDDDSHANKAAHVRVAVHVRSSGFKPLLVDPITMAQEFDIKITRLQSHNLKTTQELLHLPHSNNKNKSRLQHHFLRHGGAMSASACARRRRALDLPSGINADCRRFCAVCAKTYLAALQSAIENGMHYRFTEIHATKPTYDFAHGNCGFLLWHRKFLLAYENMLRAQGSSFKDVTLPYWNYFQDHDMNMIVGTSCNSIMTCSEFLTDHGGSNSRYPYRSDVNITSTGRTRGFCVANGVTKSACASPFGSLSGACDGCIVRGDWSNEGVFFPISKLGISHSIEKIASGSETTTDPHDTLRKVLERGFHVDVHNTLNGAMSSTASPFDPVFFGHHGTIDLIQFVHNRCHYGTNEDNRRFDVFTQCSVKTRGAFVPITSDTKITMDYGDQPAEDDPVIGKFFAGIGSTYADFANPEELGSNSYLYAVDEYFETLFKSEDVVCPPGTFASELRADRKHKHHMKHDQSDTSNDDLERNPVHEIINTLAACGKELLERMPNSTQAEVAIQKSILECEATRQRSGREFEDYSPEFRETFNMPNDSHPPCYRLLQRVKSGAITMKLSQSCRQEYGRLTGTKLMDGEFGKTFPSTTDSIDNGDEHDSESDSYDSTADSEDRDSNADSKRPSNDGSTQVKSVHLRVAVQVRTSE